MIIEIKPEAENRKTKIIIEVFEEDLIDCEPVGVHINTEQGIGIIEDAILLSMGLRKSKK